jgi:hypothetical protein
MAAPRLNRDAKWRAGHREKGQVNARICDSINRHAGRSVRSCLFKSSVRPYCSGTACRAGRRFQCRNSSILGPGLGPGLGRGLGLGLGACGGRGRPCGWHDHWIRNRRASLLRAGILWPKLWSLWPKLRSLLGPPSWPLWTLVLGAGLLIATVSRRKPAGNRQRPEGQLDSASGGTNRVGGAGCPESGRPFLAGGSAA